MAQERNINMICYADDAAIETQIRNDLQRQLLIFRETPQNMSATTEETKCIDFTRTPVRYNTSR